MRSSLRTTYSGGGAIWWQPSEGRQRFERGTARRPQRTVHSPPPLAGFGVIDAADLDEAIRLVEGTPCARAKGAVELWPIRDLEHE